MKRTERRLIAAANALILAISACVYALLVSPISVTALAAVTHGAAYRGTDRSCAAFRIPVYWEAESMDRILSELDRDGVFVTFAFTPETVGEQPTLLYRVAHAGHGVEITLENSAFTGRDAPKALSDAADTVERITGERPRFFYTGAEGERFIRAAGRLGMSPVSTTYDLGSQFASAALLEKRLASCVEPGAVYPGQPTASFAEALPFLIDLIKNMGLDIVPIHKMLYNRV